MVDFVLLAIAVQLYLSGPADAGWQYTEWGMTPDQVIAASKGAVSHGEAKSSKDGRTLFLLRGDYAAGLFNFDASFGFDAGTNGLIVVSLTLKNGPVSRLTDSLIEKYGKPVNTELTGRMVRTTVWRDTKENNVIRLFEIAAGDKSYILSYHPLQSRENEGL